MSLTLKLALSPLLVAQALLTRRRLPTLPEPEGPRAGVAGRGRPLALLIAGDSSAAGVGVVSQQQALSGQLVGRLARHRRVRWSLLARSGLTTRQTAEMLGTLPHDPRDGVADVAVIVTGVNDVVDQVPSTHAVKVREALVNRLRNAWGVRHVVFAPLPPIHHFPGLPQPLRWVAGTDAERHNRALREWAATRGDASVVAMHVPLNRGTMAADGFHPGETVYRYCGIAIADHILSLRGFRG
jgi:hypothetical protein